MQQQHATAQNKDEFIWVLGGGRFGHQAALTLRKKNPAARIVVVDPEPAKKLPDEIEIISDDGITWFTNNFYPETKVTAIIPALPRHLAAEWLKQIFTRDEIVIETAELSDLHIQSLPHPIRQNPGQVTISYADFLCPPHCNEPEKSCTYTQKIRPTPLYQFLTNMDFTPFNNFVIRSRQFAPGVGGYTPQDLWNLYSRVSFFTDAPLMLATACKCHGIIDTFTLKRHF